MSGTRRLSSPANSERRSEIQRCASVSIPLSCCGTGVLIYLHTICQYDWWFPTTKQKYSKDRVFNWARGKGLGKSWQAFVFTPVLNSP